MDEDSATSSASGGDSASPGPVHQDPSVATQSLTLADAFDVGEWEEGSQQPAGAPDDVPVTFARVSCFNGPEPLEYRFSGAEGTLVFDVGQGMSSPSSRETLAFDVEADGRQVQTVNIGFTETATVEVPLAGVTVVTVNVNNVTEDCSDDVQALLLESRIEN